MQETSPTIGKVETRFYLFGDHIGTQQIGWWFPPIKKKKQKMLFISTNHSNPFPCSYLRNKTPSKPWWKGLTIWAYLGWSIKSLFSLFWVQPINIWTVIVHKNITLPVMWLCHIIFHSQRTKWWDYPATRGQSLGNVCTCWETENFSSSLAESLHHSPRDVSSRYVC